MNTNLLNFAHTEVSLQKKIVFAHKSRSLPYSSSYKASSISFFEGQTLHRKRHLYVNKG